tara:strand:+ start:1593 stop:2888 length:1296 start_codon:yes stop_codon:yes gene_type:complete
MPSFSELKKQLLDIGAQDQGGDAENMVGVAINNVYRRVLSLLDEELSRREFTLNTTAGSASSVTSSNSENFTIVEGSSDKVQLSVNSGPSQTATLTAGSRTAEQIVSDINSAVVDIIASDSSGNVKLTTEEKSSEARIEIETVSNDAYTVLGFSVATTRGSGGSKYGLPLYARTDLNIDDPNNDRSVDEITSRSFDKSFPGNTDTGDPFNYYNLGKFGVQVQPTTDSAITIVSSSTSDVTNFHVTITGFDTSGVFIREKLALNGTSNVTSTLSFSTIERVVKSAKTGFSFSGNITVKDSNSATLSIVPIWVNSPEYVWIEFYPTPDTSRRYILRASAWKPDLVNDEDWPDIDNYFHNLILYGAGIEVLPSFGKDETAVLFKQMYTERISEYRSGVKRDPNMTQTFADVQMGRILPRTPYIPGVHMGIAKAQ